MRKDTAIAILVVLAILVVALVPMWLENSKHILPPTGLDIVRQSEYPGGVKLSLYLHHDGRCLLVGHDWAMEVYPAWCE